jgi:glycosyltransferase involved in cell wall biosynthesis
MASGPGRDEYVVLQMSMGHYRQRFLDELEDQGFPVRFLVGDSGFDDHSPTELDSPLVESTGPNLYVLGRRIGLQRRVFRRALRAPVVVVLLNPRIATTWGVMLVRRLLRRPTLAWGHAWPRRGPGARSDLARVVLRRLPTALLVYTETEKSQLQARWPGLRVFVAPNAVYPAREMQPAMPSGAEPKNVLWIGRMIEAKRPLLAIEGFERAAEHLPESCRLVMVGSGPELEAVRERVSSSPWRDRIDLTGQITEHAALAEIFGDAVVTLSTGYLGLNATQSVGFGVPVVHPDDEPHAPEIEALDESNSRSFAAQDAAALAGALVGVFRERDKWFARRDEISGRARSRYSSETMARGLIDAIEAVGGGAA